MFFHYFFGDGGFGAFAFGCGLRNVSFCGLILLSHVGVKICQAKLIVHCFRCFAVEQLSDEVVCCKLTLGGDPIGTDCLFTGFLWIGGGHGLAGVAGGNVDGCGGRIRDRSMFWWCTLCAKKE